MDLWDPQDPLESPADAYVENTVAGLCVIQTQKCCRLGFPHNFIDLFILPVDQPLLLYVQGRSGADGARGMPGQSGPKVTRHVAAS